jgi:hypothetical protein
VLAPWRRGQVRPGRDHNPNEFLGRTVEIRAAGDPSLHFVTVTLRSCASMQQRPGANSIFEFERARQVRMRLRRASLPHSRPKRSSLHV